MDLRHDAMVRFLIKNYKKEIERWAGDFCDEKEPKRLEFTLDFISL
jgi:hypothetical protein